MPLIPTFCLQFPIDLIGGQRLSNEDVSNPISAKTCTQSELVAFPLFISVLDLDGTAAVVEVSTTNQITPCGRARRRLGQLSVHQQTLPLRDA